jgi:hypothetical protein
MALKMPTPTDEARRALAAGAALFTDNDDALARLLAAAPVGLRLFTLTLDQASTNNLKTESDGWRFLASNAVGNFISGEVSRSKDGRWKLTSVSRDPKAAEPFYVAKQIEQHSRVQAKNFVISVLRIPGILLEALLLQSESDDETLLVPVVTPSKEMRVNIVHESAEFLNSIQPAIARYRKFDEFREKPPNTNR